MDIMKKFLRERERERERERLVRGAYVHPRPYILVCTIINSLLVA
jgi:hypothetical protein